jgi:hypothetical protein
MLIRSRVDSCLIQGFESKVAHFRIVRDATARQVVPKFATLMAHFRIVRDAATRQG